MLAALVDLCVRHRWVVVALGIGLLGVGLRSLNRMVVDAVPDITNVQVQVLTNAPGLSPLEVETLVSRPVELAMTGIPGTTTVRSVSRAGVSAVTMAFEDDVPLETARERVAQRLGNAREAVQRVGGRPEMGPLTTGLGEVYHFLVRWPGHSLMEIRTLLDFEVALPLRSVPGVVEVNAWGGQRRTLQVKLRDRDLAALGVDAMQVEQALLGAGHNVGGGALEHGDQQTLVRLDGQYRTPQDVENQVVATRPGGLPILVKDVATVEVDAGWRASAATAEGQGEVVYAMVQMVAGGNAHQVVARVKERLAELAPRLPPGAVVEPFYDRAALVDRVLLTVRNALVEGALLVIVLLVLLLGHLGAALVVATTIPLAMMGVFWAMDAFGVSGNLMSLGAIDFGLVVDGAVVVVEGMLAAMALHQLKAGRAVVAEVRHVGQPLLFGVFIIAVVYLPVLALQGVEGKMFRPMALTVLFALGTALVLTFTWIPAVASLVVRRAPAGDALLVRAARRLHDPLLTRMLDRPGLAVALSLLLVGVGAVAAAGRGAEFIPRLDEGDFALQVTRPPSVSVREAVSGTTVVERALRQFPEVRSVVSRIGSPDVATDVMGVEQADVFVFLRPRSEWTTAHTPADLANAMSGALERVLPGSEFSFTQPIEMRMQELLAGMKSDVGIKLFGPDLAVLQRVGGELTAALEKVPGATDVRMEPLEGLPLLTFRPRTAELGRLGIRAEELAAQVEIMRSGRHVGEMVEGERRTGVLMVRGVPPPSQLGAMASLPIHMGAFKSVPLGQVAELVLEESPALLARENNRRRVMIEGNVRGRDLATFVEDLKGALAAIPLPAGYHVELTGQYQNLQQASALLAIMVPATLLLILLLLYVAFGSGRAALLILTNVPAAVSGGVLALAARDLPFSISAAVGFIALMGVATLNGVVLLTEVMRLATNGVSPREAALQGGRQRMRPVLTTASVAWLGFVPMAFSHGSGAEVQHPLATVVLGGLLTSTLLTLVLLPALARRFAWGPQVAPVPPADGAGHGGTAAGVS